MKRYACQYAIVRFLPYAETGEFANVGLVLVCPANGYFGFRLIEKGQRGRIQAFFPEMGKTVLKLAVEAFAGELERIQRHLQADPQARQEAALLALFQRLTHPREAVVRFDTARVVLTEAPEQAVNQLFDQYVQRQFAKEPQFEEVMVKRVRALLDHLQLAHPFKPMVIGDAQYHTRFQLVQVVEDVPTRVIKPFFLAQDEPQKIYSHADDWLPKIHRLRKFGFLNAPVLFAVEAPPVADGACFAAYEDVRQELEQMQVQVIAADQDAGIAAFARGLQ